MPQQCDWDISVEDLKALLDRDAKFEFIDVREVGEFAVSNLGAELVPLSTVPERITTLDPAAHIVVHCKSGGRSAHAVKIMRAHGFMNTWNVQGGMIAWIDRIDGSLPLG